MVTGDQVLRAALQVAIWRIEDMLKSDDGQSFKEAAKALPGLKAALSYPAQSEGGEVVTVTSKLGDLCSFHSSSVRKGDKLYTTKLTGAKP